MVRCVSSFVGNLVKGLRQTYRKEVVGRQGTGSHWTWVLVLGKPLNP